MVAKSDGRTLKTISNIGFIIFMVIMAFLIFITAQSKLTGAEPSILGYRLYIVDSGSMEPALPLNSLITVKERIAEQVEVGQILTFYGSDKITRVTHRVAEIGPNGDYFITKGDANNIEDAMPVTKENVIGTVSLTIPYLGYAFRFLSTSAGIIFIVGIGILLFVVPLLLKREPQEV